LLSSVRKIVINIFAAMLIAALSVAGLPQAAEQGVTDPDPEGLADGISVIFVDINNTACSDSGSREDGLVPETPFCSLSAAIDMVVSGDTVLVREGMYNGWNKVEVSQISIIGYPGEEVLVTNVFPGFLNSSKKNWKDHGDYWSASLSENPGGPTPVHMADGTMSAAFNDFSEFKESEYDSSYVDKDKKAIFVRFADDEKDPNTEDLYVAKGKAVFNLDEVEGVSLKNLKIAYGIRQVHMKGVSDIMIEDCELVGGFNAVYMDGEKGDISNVMIRNNMISGSFDSEWTWMDIKGDDAFIRKLETSAIKMRDVKEGNEIIGNEISGWFDGISDQSTSPGNENGTEIADNRFSDISDDGIEVESFPGSIRIHNNTFSDVFVGISLAPAECGGECEIFGNRITATRQVNFEGSEEAHGECFKMGGSGGQAEGWDINSNTCVAEKHGIYGIADDPMSDVYIRDNIFVANDYVLFHSGLSESGVEYNNNLYFSMSDKGLFSCWNSDSDSATFETLAEATGSEEYDSAWDTESIAADPMFVDISDEDYTPEPGSPACEMSSTGSYVGAVPCDGAEEASSEGNDDMDDSEEVESLKDESDEKDPEEDSSEENPEADE
jgi:hypothetical protein